MKFKFQIIPSFFSALPPPRIFLDNHSFILFRVRTSEDRVLRTQELSSCSQSFHIVSCSRRLRGELPWCSTSAPPVYRAEGMSRQETSLLGKFPGRYDRECPLQTECRTGGCGAAMTAFLAEARALDSRWPLDPPSEQSYAIYDSTGIMTHSLATDTQETSFFGVHDPAWWWARTSNPWASSDAVVQFHLAHVINFFARG